MIPSDEEDRARVARHQMDRDGWGFETVEAGGDILAAVSMCDMRGAFLLDSVTALLANAMFTPDGAVETGAYKTIARDITQLMDRSGDMVIVSDYIYSDAVDYDELTESFRRGLAYIDRRLAAECDAVMEACCGQIIIHKGAEKMKDVTYGMD